MSVKAGKLDERVAFDARTDASDGAGNFKDVWTETYRCAAGILDLKGGESIVASRLQGVKPAVITVRTCAATTAVTADFRVRDLRAGTVYNIRDIMPSRRKGFIDFLCETGVAHG
jgi:SPP1 family predicted phage head-tail adaptor